MAPPSPNQICREEFGSRRNLIKVERNEVVLGSMVSRIEHMTTGRQISTCPKTGVCSCCRWRQDDKVDREAQKMSERQKRRKRRKCLEGEARHGRTIRHPIEQDRNWTQDGAPSVLKLCAQAEEDQKSTKTIGLPIWPLFPWHVSVWGDKSQRRPCSAQWQREDPQDTGVQNLMTWLRTCG